MFSARPFFVALLLIGGIFFPRLSLAQTPVGTPLKIFPWRASRLLADPVRPRLYAALPTPAAVLVVDTNTLLVIASIPVGGHPGDLTISRDGRRLYTANHDSAGPEAVSIIDLDTLQARPGIELPGGQAWTVAAGLRKRLYVATLCQDGGLFQVDTSGATAPQRIDTADYRSVYLQISPNGKRLYAAGAGTVTLDVSGLAASVLQSEGSPNDSSADELRLSHHGLWICRPDISYSSITLYDTQDLARAVGTLQMNDDPGPMTFSPDDNRLYEVPDGGLYLWTFDTHTFARTQSIKLPWKVLSSYRGSYGVADVATDATGHQLFVSGTSSEGVNATLVMATGTDAPTSLPGVSIWSDTPEVSSGGEHGSVSLSRSGDLSKPLTVSYTVSSSVVYGDYFQTVAGAVTFAAGQAIAHVEVVPLSSAYSSAPVTVKLKLAPSANYFVAKKAAKLLVYF